jgi:hypothetical protein
MANGLSPEEVIAADEPVFRAYVVMKLQAISQNCRWNEVVGRLLLQAGITGLVAVGLALLTLHLKG